MKLEVTIPFETLVTIHQLTWHHIQEDLNIQATNSSIKSVMTSSKHNNTLCYTLHSAGMKCYQNNKHPPSRLSATSYLYE
jgi:hypothetical protein